MKKKADCCCNLLFDLMLGYSGKVRVTFVYNLPVICILIQYQPFLATDETFFKVKYIL